MSDIVVYDKAKYHYQGEFPNDISYDQAFVHTGMFLGWIIDNNLFSEEFKEETQIEINKFRQRDISGTQIYKIWDGVLVDDMLNDEGNKFAKFYFDFETGLYLKDYEEIFQNIDTLYHVNDNWENYFKIKEVIDRRFKEYKSK
ncbi:hypothetical protein ACIQ2D_08980 [Lysinibacillus sp. NPDC097287]|uniref:DUF7832 domain-containing protein n=1 Tax=Lysinibacillus sp. NPDC097287 TaxID=3364144 RepID=UPI00381F4A93